MYSIPPTPTQVKDLLFEVALQYLRAGLSVLPCRNKRPLVRWKSLQERLPSEKEWQRWRDELDFNAIGLVLPPNYAVLDIEAPHVEYARQYLGAYLGQGWAGRFPLNRSGRGGLHVFVQTNRPVRSGKLVLGNRVVGDLKGSGSLVIVPPSVLDGGLAYKGLNNVSLQSAGVVNANILERLIHRQDTSQNDAGGGNYTRILRGERVHKGVRNVTLTSLAGVIRQGMGLPEDKAREFLHWANQQFCEPPLHASEVEVIVRSVYSYPYTPRRLDPENRAALEELLWDAGIRPAPTLRTAEDLLRSVEDAEWVSFLGKPGVLMRGGITLIAAEPGVGKSTLAYSVAADIVRQGGHVLYLSEDSEGVWKNRLPALDTESRKRFFIAVNGVDAESLDDELIAQAEAIRPDLVVVDTFRVWTPVEDENAAAQVNAAAERIRRLARRTNAAVLVLHHLSASGKVAGSHVFRAFPDLVYELRRGKFPNVRILRAVKRRHPDAPDFGVLAYDRSRGYYWAGPRNPAPPDGQEDARASSHPSAKKENAGGGLSPRAREVLFLLQTRGPMSAEDVARALGYSRAYAHKWLKELQGAGEIRVTRPGGKGRGRRTLYAPRSPSGGGTEKMSHPHGYVISGGSTPKESATGKANGHELHFMSATEADSGENVTRGTENVTEAELHFTAYSHADLRPKMKQAVYKNTRVPKTGTRIEGQGVAVSQGENETRPEPASGSGGVQTPVEPDGSTEDMHARPPEPADTLSAFADTSPNQPTPPPTTLTDETETQKTEDADDFSIWAIWTIEMPNTRRDGACPFRDCPFHTSLTPKKKDPDPESPTPQHHSAISTKAPEDSMTQYPPCPFCGGEGEPALVREGRVVVSHTWKAEPETIASDTDPKSGGQEHARSGVSVEGKQFAADGLNAAFPCESFFPVENPMPVECAGCGKRILAFGAVRSKDDPKGRTWHVNCAPALEDSRASVLADGSPESGICHRPCPLNGSHRVRLEVVQGKPRFAVCEGGCPPPPIWAALGIPFPE